MLVITQASLGCSLAVPHSLESGWGHWEDRWSSDHPSENHGRSVAHPGDGKSLGSSAQCSSQVS
jgi:hypothetical protein